jgi:transcriptional repressor NrdR
VVKRSGVTEPFSRAKILSGVRKACQGRPVGEDELALLAQRVEEAVRSSGAAEIEAHEVGLAVLAPLRELDEVAYLRFASVYQAFDSLEDFESAITVLRAEREPTGSSPAATNAGRSTPSHSARPSPPAASRGKPDAAGGTTPQHQAGKP